MTTSLQPLRRTLIVLAASAALALSGCGGDEPDPGASASPEHSDHADQSDSPSPSKSDGPVEAAATVDVTIEGDEVTPVAQAVQIGVGETVSIPGYGTYKVTGRGQVPNPGTTNDVIAVFGGFPRAILQTCIPGTTQMLVIALN